MNGNQNNNINISDDRLVMPQQNTYINNTTTETNINLDQQTTAQKAPIDYSQDPKVRENMQKKNTITVSGDSKVMILIAILILLFIFLLPTIYGFLN